MSAPVTGTIDFAGIPAAALLGSANAAIGMALRQSAGVVVRTIDTRLA